MFNPRMIQTPQNVRNVLDIAGWNANEAAHETGIDAWNIHAASTGEAALTGPEWVRLLDVAGRRAFDWDQ